MTRPNTVIIRYTMANRVNHWITAICFVLLVLSGLSMFHPMLFFLSGLFGGGQWTRAVHPWIGCVLLITLQAIINLGVVTSLLPSKGMSLPFISAGGSNLLLMGLLVGVIINSQRTWERPKPLVRRRSLTEVVA